MSASKPTTPVSATRSSVDSRIPREVAWPSVRENRELAAKHRPPKTVKLPSGAVVVAPFNRKGQRMFLPKE